VEDQELIAFYALYIRRGVFLDLRGYLFALMAMKNKFISRCIFVQHFSFKHCILLNVNITRCICEVNKIAKNVQRTRFRVD